MSCNNCFNGCAEIISDKCVKYTGIAIPGLGIQTGDTLSFVEQALSTFLLSTLNGTGIKIDVSDIDICPLVQKYLPTCGDLTIVDISKALIQAACDLQEQVDVIDGTLITLNADYTIGCLTGVTASSDTHAIVQATINKLCALQLDVTALALDLVTNYISVDTIDSYIAAYLASTGASTLISSKMVPYSILPFYGTLTGKFDGTGAGIGDWARIFLCNGNNPGVPDLRGRVPVGSTSMFGGTLPSQTNPSVTGNPDYGIPGTVSGANQIVLNATQIPSHTHLATSTVTDPGHTHPFQTPSFEQKADFSTNENVWRGAYTTATTASNVTGLTVNTVNASAGGGLAHSNIQPVISVYYIIYIP